MKQTSQSGRSRHRKGLNAERQVAQALRELGWPEARRIGNTGNPEDVGDIDGIDNFTIEVKNQHFAQISRFVNELERKQKNRGTEHGVVILKRPTFVDPRQWYAICEVENFFRLVKQHSTNK